MAPMRGRGRAETQNGDGRGELVRLEAARIVEERADPPRVPRLYSVCTIAGLGDCPQIHVRRAIRDGRLRAYMVAGTVRILEEDLLRFLVSEGLPAEVIASGRDGAGRGGS